MKTMFALLVLCLVSAAALDQTYVHVVERDGSSAIEKTMDLSLLSVQMNPGAFDRMAAVCDASAELDCSVDAESRTVVLRDSFQPGVYYTHEVEYGLPFTTYTLTINSIPTDRFGRLLDQLFDKADATNIPSGAASPLHLRDRTTNREGAALLRELEIRIDYVVEMPSGISEAYAGETTASLEGDKAGFDLVSVLEESEPMVVKRSELNLGYLVLIGGVVVLAALAWSFLGMRPKPKKPQKKRKK